jgi:hypothetical protein
MVLNIKTESLTKRKHEIRPAGLSARSFRDSKLAGGGNCLTTSNYQQSGYRKWQNRVFFSFFFFFSSSPPQETKEMTETHAGSVQRFSDKLSVSTSFNESVMSFGVDMFLPAL